MILQIVLQPTNSAQALAPTSSASVDSVLTILGFSLGLLVGVILLVWFLRKLKKPELEGISTQKVKALWEQIEHSAKQGKLGGKMAVIEADKLLDTVLKSMRFPGDTMGERLKAAGYKHPAIREVWTAHRVRNRLVHETDYELRDRDVRETLGDFKQALRELNVL